jgi:flagellar basal-body rod modification protein FlgD
MIPSSTYAWSNYGFYTPENSPVSATTKTGTTQGSQKSELNISSLGKNDFLKLLLAQLKNQDPLNPDSNTEFVAQLAQFSSLEQMTQMNTNLENSMTNNNKISEAVNNAMLVNYIGKNVQAESSAFIFDGSNEAKLQFSLDTASPSVKVEIMNDAGTVVKTMDLGAGEAGDNQVSWDGNTSLGVLSKSGVYSYKVTAKDTLGADVNVTPLYAGAVDGVSYKDGTSYLNVGGILISYDKIKNIY